MKLTVKKTPWNNKNQYAWRQSNEDIPKWGPKRRSREAASGRPEQSKTDNHRREIGEQMVGDALLGMFVLLVDE